ncbi:MAG TPA: alpha/beta fold hydrolase [Baekduia sp.]|jgi:pimeloyl-ACP methyl ester carboxylesterase|nr:alpha/beta fold hydrolase [Baekduia sp.]
MSDPRLIAGLLQTDHELSVPLDHDRPDGERIAVYAREVAHPDGADRPMLVYFEGGPGSEAPRPAGPPTSPGWLPRALQEFRVLLLDQRGTGRSSPIGTLPGLTPAEQAQYLTHFRADAIVRDAEHFRVALGIDRWAVLGQSFGGMCVTRYLSHAPDGLSAAVITAGLPALEAGIDQVYEATFARTLQANHQHYARYPEDRTRVLALHEQLAAEDVRLPSGDRLTPRRLRQLGNVLGMSGGTDRLHHLLELPVGSPAFLHDVEAAMPFARQPLWAIIHEALWADGGTTRWAADRVLPEVFQERPELFTAEHVFPWMFEEYGALAPLREAADILAAHQWPRLYDREQLRRNTVPVAALICAEDLYVPRAFSEAAAAEIGGLRPWLTNELSHDGLRVDGPRVLGRLLDLVSGRC